MRGTAMLFGVAFLVAGIAGFIPAAAPDNMLFGIFRINTVHNIVHILSGLAALFCASSALLSKRYFQVFGIIYALVALLGILVGHGHIFNMIANNPADAWLHVGIAALSLYLGFLSDPATQTKPSMTFAR